MCKHTDNNGQTVCGGSTADKRSENEGVSDNGSVFTFRLNANS